jgi:hypothetical protein
MLGLEDTADLVLGCIAVVYWEEQMDLGHSTGNLGLYIPALPQILEKQMAPRYLAYCSCLLKNLDPGTLVPVEILEKLKVHSESTELVTEKISLHAMVALVMELHLLA